VDKEGANSNELSTDGKTARVRQPTASRPLASAKRRQQSQL